MESMSESENEIAVEGGTTHWSEEDESGARELAKTPAKKRAFLETTAKKRRAVKRAIQTTVNEQQDNARRRLDVGIDHAQGGNSFRQINSIKLEAFPKVTNAAERLGKWKDYRRQVIAKFELLDSCVSERTKANYLYTNIGIELMDIIEVRAMLPSAREVCESYEFFEMLIQNLDDYFNETSDKSLMAASFTSNKQKQGETARDFQIRMTKLARNLGMDPHDVLFREVFLMGLSDSFIVNRAKLEAWTVEQTVTVAARKEQMQPGPTPSPLAGIALGQESVVAAIQGKSTTDARRFRQSRPSSADRRSRLETGEPCSDCGFTKHRSSTCPAAGKACNGCGKIGHFRKMCRNKKRVAVVNEDVNAMNQQEEKVFDKTIC